jgi:hypothetical protein
MSDTRGCPACGREDRLYSVETMVVEYHVSISAEGDMDYTGQETRYFDETAEPHDLIHCRNCDWEGPSAECEAGL